MSAAEVKTPSSSLTTQTVISFPVRKSERLNKNLEQSFTDLKLRSPALSNKPKANQDDDDQTGDHYSCQSVSSASSAFPLKLVLLKSGVSVKLNESSKESNIKSKSSVEPQLVVDLDSSNSPFSTPKSKRNTPRKSIRTPNRLVTSTAVSSPLASSKKSVKKQVTPESVVKNAKQLFAALDSCSNQSQSSASSCYSSQSSIINSPAKCFSSELNKTKESADEVDQTRTPIKTIIRLKNLEPSLVTTVELKEDEQPQTPTRKSSRLTRRPSVYQTPNKEINRVKEQSLDSLPTTPTNSQRSTRSQTPTKHTKQTEEEQIKTPTVRRNLSTTPVSKLTSSKKQSPGKRKQTQRSSEDVNNVNENDQISPSKISRYFQPESKPKQLNLFQKYKQALATGNGDRLVYREVETQQVEQFLRTHLKNETSSSLYISGPPGTGKTATIKSIAARLEDEFSFRFIAMNGMSFANPSAFYQKLLLELGQKKVANKQLLSTLEVQLCSRKKMLVLLLDEIDELDSKHQEMLYTVFEWPRLETSKVIIIGIANTLDLTSKTLVRMHTLKLAPMHEIPFRPYDRAQIAGILNERIRKLKEAGDVLIDDAAIELCARKVSSYSGDARKALDILRRSIELAEHELLLNQQEEQNKLVLKSRADNVEQANEPLSTSFTSATLTPTVTSVDLINSARVKVTHVIKIINQVFGSRAVAVQEDECNFPLQQQLLLCCCFVLMSRESCKEVEVGKCFDTFVRICNQKHLSFDVGNTSDFVSMCYLLEAKGFISLKSAKQIRAIKLSLSIDEEEVREMLLNKPLFRSILKVE